MMPKFKVGDIIIKEEYDWHNIGEIQIIDIDFQAEKYRLLFDDNSRGWHKFKEFDSICYLVNKKIISKKHPLTNIFQ